VANRDFKVGDHVENFHIQGVYPTQKAAQVNKYYVLKWSNTAFSRLTTVNNAHKYNNYRANLANHHGSKDNTRLALSDGGRKARLVAKKKINRGDSILWNYNDSELTRTFMQRKAAVARRYPNLRQGKKLSLTERKSKKRKLN
jgi:hypothetical protein